MRVAFANRIFFSKNISVYAISFYQNFNDMLTYNILSNILSFEQLDPDFFLRENKASGWLSD